MLLPLYQSLGAWQAPPLAFYYFYHSLLYIVGLLPTSNFWPERCFWISSSGLRTKRLKFFELQPDSSFQKNGQSRSWGSSGQCLQRGRRQWELVWLGECSASVSRRMFSRLQQGQKWSLLPGISSSTCSPPDAAFRYRARWCKWLPPPPMAYLPASKRSDHQWSRTKLALQPLLTLGCCPGCLWAQVQ